jgi:hypothetical protein
MGAGTKTCTNGSQKQSMLNKNHRKGASKLSETHRANIQKRLEHRLEVAKAKGDEHLVRMLEAEMEQL